MNNNTIDDYFVRNNKQIKRVDNYPHCKNSKEGNKILIKFECLNPICNNIWESTVNSVVIKHSGCPKCARRKITNEVIDENLKSRNIKRLSNYIHTQSKIDFQCGICDHKWSTKYNAIAQGTGCPSCAGCAPHTNQSIDKALEGRLIRRCNDYVSENMTFECLKCLYVWKPDVHSVMRGSGCASCSNRLKPTNESIDKRLLDELLEIERIGNYVDSHTEIDFKCLKCNATFLASHKVTKCKKCDGLVRLTNEIIDERLLKNNPTAKRISDYKYGENLNYQCLVEGCNNIWAAHVNLIYGTPACPKHFKCIRYTNELVDEWLKNSSIVRLENIRGQSKYYNWKCTQCNNIIKNSARCIVENQHCAVCHVPSSNGGIDRDLEGKEIIRLSNFVEDKLTEFKCIKCNFSWNTRKVAKINCPCCSKVYDKNNLDIDNSLIDVKRLGFYIDKFSSIKFQCNKCYDVWETNRFVNIVCRKCNPRSPYSNEVLDDKLIPLNMIRLDEFTTSNKQIKIKCIDNACIKEWLASPYEILYDENFSCPERKRKKILDERNKKIDEDLVGRNITRVSNCFGTHSKTTFLCGQCNKEWSSVAKDVTSGSGCPNCFRKYTDDSIDKLLIDNKVQIQRIGSFMLSNSNKVKFKCLKENCNNIWEARPSYVVDGTHGCPKCSAGKNEKLVYAALEEVSISFEYQKQIKYIKPNEKRQIRADFVIDDKIIVEYNGTQHYQPVSFGKEDWNVVLEKFEKQKERDAYLQNFCDENNIKLIWIDGRTYHDNKLKEYMKDVIIPEIKSLCKNSLMIHTKNI